MKKDVYQKIGFMFLVHLAAIAIVLLFLIPMWWGLVTSFKPHGQEFSFFNPLQLNAVTFSPFTWDGYTQLIKESLFVPAFVNTTIVCVVTIFFGLLFNGFAGFILATQEFRGKNAVIGLIVLSFLISGDILVLPTYNLINDLHLIDTKTALILPGVINGTIIFMFMQFFKDIPKDFAEAAYLDGLSPITVFFTIYLPLTIPAAVGAGLLLFLGQWESFLWPLLVSRSPENTMLQVAISSLNQEHGTLWSQVLAASTISALVPLAILLPLQKYYISSVVGSGVK